LAPRPSKVAPLLKEGGERGPPRRRIRGISHCSPPVPL
jgi:hypothetical protein